MVSIEPYQILFFNLTINSFPFITLFDIRLSSIREPTFSQKRNRL
jgi:hypothetical protein